MALVFGLDLSFSLGCSGGKDSPWQALCHLGVADEVTYCLWFYHTRVQYLVYVGQRATGQKGFGFLLRRISMQMKMAFSSVLPQFPPASPHLIFAVLYRLTVKLKYHHSSSLEAKNNDPNALLYFGHIAVRRVTTGCGKPFSFPQARIIYGKRTEDIQFLLETWLCRT